MYELELMLLRRMGSFNVAVGDFADLMERIQRVSPEAMDHLQEACILYLDASVEAYVPSEDEIDRIFDALPYDERITRALESLGYFRDLEEHPLLVALLAWSACMTASRWGLTPWEDIVAALEEEADAI
jgi:hypothetical protein